MIPRNSLDIKPCSVCGSVQSYGPILSKENDMRGSGKISLYRCKSCKVVYLGGYKNKYVEELYSYYKKYTGMPKHEVYDELTRKSYMKVLDLISSKIDGTCILDVGSGKGDFVEAAQNQGFDITGIELSKDAVDIANKFNLPVYNLDFFSDSIRESSKDIVTMFEVIEHVPDPVSFIRRAQAIVKPGGIIYITTPNYNSVDRKILGSRWGAIHREHLTYFTPATLLKLVNEYTDLEVLHKETRNISAELIGYITHYGGSNNSEGQYKREEDCKVDGTRDARSIIDKSYSLSLMKHTANVVLDVMSLGCTIILLLRRPM